MWFLEHEILFGGKRVWLRPGSQQLFGRTKSSHGDGSAGKNVFIDNKNVSRKHMMIKVLDVSPADGTKLHTRSQVEITDLSCRQGTIVDGRTTLKSSKDADGEIAYDRAILSGTEHTIKVSNSYPPFVIKWQDVVFTYASKEKKGSSQASTRNAELHAMDVKTSSEFVYGKTTHVVSQKRNLPKVLQALLSGIPIVTPDYIDAILGAAANSTDPEGHYMPSKLEEDFDTWWPQEKEYIPPAGQEPVPRPDQMLAPDPTRAEVFAGLTFIFLNEVQHTSLHQVIAGGGGKALFFDIRPGETTVEEYVDYVMSVAGKKKRTTANNALPVVTIRLPAPDGFEEWATDFVTGVDRSLNQRSILQNEFLDAIITKDTSSLRRPPTVAMDIASSMPEAAQTQRSLPEPTPTLPSQAPPQASEATPAPADEPVKTVPRKRPMRRNITSRFTGFDDYEPPPKARKVENPPTESVPLSNIPTEDTPMQDVQQSVPEEEPNTQSQIPPATQTQSSKRPQSELPVENSLPLDKMFPNAAEIKRRRAATEAPTASIGSEAQAAMQKGPTKIGRHKVSQDEQKNKLKDVNIKAEARKRTAEEEDRRRDEEEKLRAALEGVDISKIHVDVQIRPMKIRPREERQAARSESQGEHWNPEWDGRKNFKKFRRRGAEPAARTQKVIVTLKQAPPRKGFGDSMAMDEEQPVRTAEDERRLKRRIGRVADEDFDDEPGFRRRKRAKPTEVITIEDSGPDEEEVPGASAMTIRNSGRTQRVVETQLEDASSQKGLGKRAGGPLSVAAGLPSAKRSRRAKRDEDSDDEEGGFRLRKRA